MRPDDLRICPLGDQALLIHVSNEDQAQRIAEAIRHAADAWLVDVVQAYASVGVFFDLNQVSLAVVADRLRSLADLSGSMPLARAFRRHEIPCCYEFESDMPRVVAHTGLAAEEVIRLHHHTEYHVCAIGFCPGFPYLGYLPSALAGVPRLPTPRLRVEPGTVGLTGRQTGIYTEARPGGWNLIAKTPLILVDVADGYFPLATGDRVQFVRIDENEFRRQLGRRL
jgi:inhibitor of KinA